MQKGVCGPADHCLVCFACAFFFVLKRNNFNDLEFNFICTVTKINLHACYLVCFWSLIPIPCTKEGRCSGQMVNALDPGLSGPGSSPHQGTVLRSYARHFILIVPLSILLSEVYKWVMLAYLVITSIPSRGE